MRLARVAFTYKAKEQKMNAMCFHSPERKMFERAHFFEVKEIDGLLRVIKELEV